MTKERNRPSEEGRLAGEHLARFADVEEERWRKEMGFVPQRCQSCAYRKGTYPNTCAATVLDAMKCSLERVPFMCHHGVKIKQPGQKPERICAGWLLMHRADAPVAAPWPWAGAEPE